MSKYRASGSLYSEKQYPVGEGGGEGAQNLPETENKKTWVCLWLYEVEAGLGRKLARLCPAHTPHLESTDGPNGQQDTHTVSCCCHLGERR